MRIELNLDELERMAKAATPGPWHSPGLGEVHDDANNCVIVDVCWPEEGVPAEDSVGGGTQADADFVAAANPATILELVRRLREAEGEESCDDIKLAEMIMSDCGISSDYAPLKDRIARRIAKHRVSARPCQGHARQQEIDEATVRDLATQAGAEWHESFDDECAMNMEMLKRFARLVLATKSGD